MYIMSRTSVLYITFFVNIFELKADYQINDKIIPSYLNRTFTNLEDDIFPSDITISLSLTTISGTLLYSIDSDGNQLIISLNDAMTPVFDVEFSKEHFYVSIAKLCGLERPLFNNLTLRIQLREKLYLQCNDGTMEFFRYNRTRKQNMAYPIPTFPKSDKLQAYLWLVNTPQMGDIYPNGAQLSGCIFGVWYKKELLTMGTHAVKGNCSKTCEPNICHGGECFETYNHVPICNCTSSFLNGPHCNESLLISNYNLTERQLQFKTVKISFKSLQIFEVNNKLGTLAKLQYDNGVLSFLISSRKDGVESLLKGTLGDKFQKNDHHIVIMTFNEKDVYIQYRNNDTKWIMKRIPYFRDLSRDIFENILIICSNWSFSYRNDPKELRWSRLDYSNDQKIDLTRLKKMNCYACQNISNCTIPVTPTAPPFTSSQAKSIRTTTVNTLSSQDSTIKGTIVASEDTVTRTLVWSILILLVLLIVVIVIVLLVMCRRGIRKVECNKRFKAKRANDINGGPNYSKNISKTPHRRETNVNDMELKASETLIDQKNVKHDTYA